MNVPEVVSEYIQELHLLAPKDPVLVAVSGGADSLCLLLVLRELDFPVSVAHFDHGLRPESAEEPAFVGSIAEKLGVGFFPGRGDVRGWAERKRMTLEEAARDLRYDFLLQTAAANKIGVIAIGHTADDQAETVLMHLMRGSGLQGLRGIRPSAAYRGARIIRPLLRLTHAQTTQYCGEAGWQPLDDPTNRDPAYARNRVRGELIPFLRGYNPQIVPVLCRLSEIAAAQTDLLDRAAGDFWNAHVPPAEPGVIRIPRAAFNQSPLAVRQEVIRRAVAQIAGTLRDLAYRHVSRAIEFSLTPTSTRAMNLALGIDVTIESQSLVLRSRGTAPLEPDWNRLPLPLPGVVAIHHPDWTFHLARLEPDRRSPVAPGDPLWSVRLDGDKIRPPFILRMREPGDRFFPSGMPGAVKLNDFLAAHHLPRAERDRWPLVCDSEGIVWIPGFRLREGAVYKEGSQQGLEMRIERNLTLPTRIGADPR